MPQALKYVQTGTDQAGRFVRGDGILATTDELLPLCNLPDAETEVCASTTDLAGIVVNNTDLMNNGQEAACEISLDDVELETCPAGTALVGVAVQILMLIQLHSHQPVVPQVLKYVQWEQTKKDTL